jgi:glutathione-regulated potassium-efflux system ancillary protein KefG
MKKILILFAHPRYENSRANRALLEPLRDLKQVTIHDLYEQYPNFNISIVQEQQLLLSHQIIVWQFPFYMYSAPAMVKQWIDLVLEHGWAHGAGVRALENRTIFATVTTGGSRESYASDGFNRHTMGEFLLPFQQTARLCSMNYLPPFLVQGTYRLTDPQLARFADQYRNLLVRISQTPLAPRELSDMERLNDWATPLPQSHD